MTQPEAARVERGPITEVPHFALGMAALLERQGFTVAANELRRLHAELERCKQVCAATSEAWREEAALAEPATCGWHGDEDGAYETSCGHIFQMLDGTPQENNFTHCCFCGKSMVQHLWEENNDD